MGFRLSKIYTKTGDAGKTHAGANLRVDKFAPEICAMGDVDELNSSIGIVIAHLDQNDLIAELSEIQHLLFNVGGEISMVTVSLIKAEHVSVLEERLDAHNECLSSLKDFILPGGCVVASYVHVARSQARRAERSLHYLCQQDTDRKHIEAKKFLNRLSDYLFVLARVCNLRAKEPDVLWRNPTKAT